MKKIAIVLVLVALSFAAYTQAQPGRRGGGGGGSSLTIERDWALICFAVKVRGDNLRALQLAYQDAWDQRSELMKGMSAGGDRTAMGEAMGKIQAMLDTSVRNILTQEQMNLFEALRNQGGGRSGGGRGRGGR